MSEYLDIFNQLDFKKSNSYTERLNHLKSLGRDTSLIDDGVQNVVRKINDGKRSLVIYGEPQSGKTEFMIALVCKLLDIGHKTIFIIMNDNTELETQNYNRFKRTPELGTTPNYANEFIELPLKDKKTDLPRIIFCRKNAKNLNNLINETRFLKGKIIIDDEADYASPDTKINKPGEQSRINELVEKLGDLKESGEGIYLGVTATPGRLDLNNTFFNQSDDWVFLKPHKQYQGREFFFPYSNSHQGEEKYLLSLLPEEGDNPKHLIEAALRFIVRTAILNCIDTNAAANTKNLMAYSMLIHTAGKKNDHEKDFDDIQKLLSVLVNQDTEEKKFKKYLNYLGEQTEIFINKFNLTIDVRDVMAFIFNNISKKGVYIINSDKKKDNVMAACEPLDIFTFAIGGNIVSRGLTFNRLLTFFFSRGVKGKLQQNTYIQRARMFGTRDYIKYFDLCVPETLFTHWAECFSDHHLSLKSAQAGNYVHFSSKKNTSADNASIDKDNIVSVGRSEWRVGEKFSYSPELEEKIFSGDQRPTDYIRNLIKEGLLPNNSFDNIFLEFIDEVSHVNQSDVALVSDKNNKIVSIARYGDADLEDISRARGGLIQATIRGTIKQDLTHHIMPICNGRSEARFLYRQNTGKHVIRNLLKK